MNQLLNIFYWIVIAGSIGYWLYCFGKHIKELYDSEAEEWIKSNKA